MHIRCKQCHGVVQILPDDSVDQLPRSLCLTCGQPYALKLPGDIAALKEKLFSRARSLAQEHGIDLPGAYSILIGVMDLEQVRSMQGALSSVDSGPPAHAEPERKPRYDPGFQEAVEAGLLTPMQAFERGKRDALAARLSEKHGISLDRALFVADNRVSLLSEIREIKAKKSESAQLELPPSASRAESSRRVVVALMGVLAAVFLWVNAGKHEDGNSVDLGNDVQLLMNTDGQIVRIEGPDPASVLDAYCKSGEWNREFECSGLMPSAGNEPDLALGILTDRAAPENQVAIYISKDRSGRRWTAGNGRSPLVAFQAPE
jgi:hypothetical protein